MNGEEEWGNEENEGEDELRLMAGYGKSDKPHGSSTHVEYCKRTMADDMVQLMYVPVLLLLPFLRHFDFGENWGDG